MLSPVKLLNAHIRRESFFLFGFFFFFFQIYFLVLQTLNATSLTAGNQLNSCESQAVAPGFMRHGKSVTINRLV